MRMGLKILRVIKDNIGLYSKNDCTKIAIDIGKDLVDISKKDVKLDKGIFSQTIKKFAPKANIRFFTSEKEFIEELQKAGENYETLRNSLKNYKACFFSFEKTKGIYVRSLENLSEIPIVAHEIEHYLYNEHTLLRRMLIKFAKKMSPKQSAKTKKQYEQISTESNIQTSLWNLFGINNFSVLKKMKNIKPTEEAVTEFLKSNAYNGLTSEKRISAYIRGIVRAHMHPKNKDSLPKLLLTKTTLDDEIRAYTVSDVVRRYSTGSETITNEGFIAQIYKRTSMIIENEIKKFFELSSEGKLIKEGETSIRTTLPTSACPENLLGMEYGDDIKITKLESIKVSDLKEKIFDKKLKPQKFVKFEA